MADFMLLAAVQGLTNAVDNDLEATDILAEATPANAFVTCLNSKRYLTVMDYPIGSVATPATCFLGYEDSLQYCPDIKNQVFYSSKTELTL